MFPVPARLDGQTKPNRPILPGNRCFHNVLDIRYDDRYNAPTTADRTSTMAQRSSAYLETIIAFLLPYFSAAAADLKDARSEIIDTLASYATRTRAEMLQAAHI
jgi:hypothetical protein